MLRFDAMKLLPMTPLTASNLSLSMYLIDLLACLTGVGEGVDVVV